MILLWRKYYYWCVSRKDGEFDVALDDKTFPRWVWKFWRKVNPHYKDL